MALLEGGPKAAAWVWAEDLLGLLSFLCCPYLVCL
jgi:hypothetical protein